MSKGAYIGALKAEYEPAFADNSWRQIIKACQKNEVPSTWSTGDSKPMTINGTDYQIDIIGKNHDDYADGSGKAPLTFQLHDVYGTTYGMYSTRTTNGNWKGSAMRTTRLPDVLALMPAEVQSAVKEVNKFTAANSASAAVSTIDKLFLLSEVEVFGSSDYSQDGEGSVYEYYANGGSTIKKFANGNAYDWWLRSPRVNSGYNFCAVSSGGGLTAYSNESYSGVAFAFCFGGDSEVDSVFGGYSVARKVKKGYIGIDGKARKIKKAYIGIGGVARPCWSGGGKLEYYGTITGGDLTRGSDKIGGTSNNKYAIFGGGTNSSYGNRLEVYGYNENLTKTVATNLSNCSTEASMCTGSNGKHGIFAGGYQYYRGDKFYNTIDAYDETLTKATATLSTNINRHSGTKVGNYSVHLGGKTSSAQESGLVTAIDKSLTVQYLTQVTTGGYSSRESTNKYAMFGRNGYSTLYAYDDQLTQTMHESPINGAFNDSAAATGNAVVFIEQYSYGYSGNIACDNSFTFSTIAKPERNYSNQMGCSFGDFAMFVGGVNWSGSQGYNTTDSYAYDSSLVLTQIGSLKYTRAYGAAKAVGNYAVVAGGIVDGADTGTTTEAYTIV